MGLSSSVLIVVLVFVLLLSMLYLSGITNTTTIALPSNNNNQSKEVAPAIMTPDEGNRSNGGNHFISSADELCSKYGEWASIADEGGFVTTRPFHNAPNLEPNTQTPDRKPSLYEFVLAPNSTGHITMVYDSCSVNTFNREFGNNYNYTSTFFKSFDTHLHGLAKFDSNEQSESFKTGQVIWLQPNETGGITVYPSSIKMGNSDHQLIVTYTLEANSNAQRGLYIINLFHICPGELLTIGDKPHQGEIPWVNGTFNGCSF